MMLRCTNCNQPLPKGHVVGQLKDIFKTNFDCGCCFLCGQEYPYVNVISRATGTDLIHTNENELAEAFTEWARSYKKNPDSYLSRDEAFAVEPESYGKAIAPIFVDILLALKKSKGVTP